MNVVVLFVSLSKGNVKYVAFGAGGEYIETYNGWFYVYLCKQYDK